MKKELEDFLPVLQKRFEENMNRHENFKWVDIMNKLEAEPEKIEVLYRMETTGGEPDVVFYDKDTDTYGFFDCAKESPKERRSFCYDREGLESRKSMKPANNAVDAAAEIGIEILNEEKYRYLQILGEFDTKTSSWIQTPKKIRDKGGALFCDYRYGAVFVYHNGAESYYSSRGFRGCLYI